MQFATWNFALSVTDETMMIVASNKDIKPFKTSTRSCLRRIPLLTQLYDRGVNFRALSRDTTRHHQPFQLLSTSITSTVVRQQQRTEYWLPSRQINHGNNDNSRGALHSLPSTSAIMTFRLSLLMDYRISIPVNGRHIHPRRRIGNLESCPSRSSSNPFAGLPHEPSLESHGPRRTGGLPDQDQSKHPPRR